MAVVVHACTVPEQASGPANNQFPMRVNSMSLIMITLQISVWLGTVPSGNTPPGSMDRGSQEVLVHRISPSGEKALVARIPRSAVATICRMNDDSLIMAHQWFPDDVPDMFDHIAVHFSNDEGRTWTATTPVEIPGLPARTRFPFDPTIIQMADGRMRMYFTLMQGNDPAKSKPTIGSAISSNGINWTFERGDRFVVPDVSVMNCAVARISGSYELIAPVQPGIGTGAYSASSKDGLVFGRNENLPIMGADDQWLGCLLEAEGRLRFYGTSTTSGIWTADLQPDGQWMPGPVLDVPGSDPGVVRLDDGTLIVATTNPASPDPTGQATQDDSSREIPRPASRQEINDHLEHLLASSDNLDWNRFANTFAPTATGFLSTPSKVHRLETGTAVANAFKPSTDDPEDTRSATYPRPRNPRNLDIQTHGDSAIATFHTDHEYDQTGWWTVVMKRDDEQSDWKVHHIHASVHGGSSSNSNTSSWP